MMVVYEFAAGVIERLPPMLEWEKEGRAYVSDPDHHPLRR